jgi:hypothetical protein
MKSTCHSEPGPDYMGATTVSRMTSLTKLKGGDAYGKVPKRIAIASRRGEENDAWPGHELNTKS